MKTKQEKLDAIRRIINNTPELPNDGRKISPTIASRQDTALAMIMYILYKEDPSPKTTKIETNYDQSISRT